MKRTAFFLALIFAFAAHAQTPGQFQITKITKNLITTPQYTYGGAQQYQANQRERWLEVEVSFASAPEFTGQPQVVNGA